MSLMLASVNSLAEALLVQSHQVDIIDLKQPAQGALGALDCQTVAEIVAALPPQTRISATIGDLPMQKDVVCKAVLDMAATGVGFIKIGFFPGGDWPAVIAGLSAIASQGYPLIAVLFADTQPDFAIIETLADAGFYGVMLDTMDKRHGSLRHWLNHEELQDFVEKTDECGLLSGLAGSLAADDIAALLPLQADYLGFRGALCSKSERTAGLDEAQIAEIRRLLQDE